MDLKKLQNGSDIRGVALPGVENEPVTLTSEAVCDLARGFASWLKQKTGKDTLTISIGHDSRLSAQTLKEAAIHGLLFDGVHILDAGLASTPSMFMSCLFDSTKADGAIMITASHLPWNRNGLKFFTPQGGLDKEDIAQLIEIAQNQAFVPSKGGSLTKSTLMDTYSSHLRTLIKDGVQAEVYEQPLKDLHIVVDAGNGAGGFYADKVLKPLGANTEGSQFLNPDGHFPNHIPNPENAQAMASIASAVQENGADLGIIFDTDVDRMAAVDEKGNPVARNDMVALAAVLAAKDHPGTTVVTDSVTSQELHDFLEEKGIQHVRYRRGYKNVINKAKELNEQGVDAQLAIETSGHAAFKENHFLDDGAYLATKIIIEAANASIADLIADLDHPAREEEVRFAIRPENFQAYGQKVIEDFQTWAQSKPYITIAPDNYEGCRIQFDEDHGDGWALLRLSLHDPILPLNLESRKENGIEEMAAEIAAFIKDYDVDASQLEALVHKD